MVDNWLGLPASSKVQENEPAIIVNSIQNTSFEGLSSIEQIAKARVEKHQIMKNAHQDDEQSDTNWFTQSLSPKREDLSNSESTASAKYDSRTPPSKTDDNIFKYQVRPVTSSNINNAPFLQSSTVIESNTSTLNDSLGSTSKSNVRNSKYIKTTESMPANQSYNIHKGRDYTNFFSQEVFRTNLKEAIIEQYLISVEIVDAENDNSVGSVAYTIMLSGSEFTKVMGVYDALDLFFSTSLKKKIFNKTMGSWTSHPQVAEFIQRYCQRENITCLCEVKENIGLIVYFFESPTILKYLCTTESTITNIVNKKCCSANFTIPEELDDVSVSQYIRYFEEFILQPIYKENILVFRQESNLLVFGLTHCVKALVSEQEKFAQHFYTGEAKHDLKDYQVKFLCKFQRQQMKLLEEHHTGLKIFDGIEQGYFIGPKKIHKKVKDELQQLVANIQQRQLDIDNVSFGFIAQSETKNLKEIGVAHQCILKSAFISQNVTCMVPNSRLGKRVDKLVPAAMSIDIRLGDLATQSVDVVVVCSTSEHLLNDILRKAGTTVQQQARDMIKNITPEGLTTPGGELLCKKLFFLPWVTEKLDDMTTRKTIQTFFTTAMKYALNTGATSIAFPALGCGLLRYDANFVAETILEETQRYANYKLKILIVLLTNQQENYRAFCIKLAEMRQRTSTKKLTSLTYPYKVARLALAGSEEKLNECWMAIQNYVNECVLTVLCDDFPFETWDQTTIDSFYRYCFDQRVLPEIDASSSKFKLSGSKEQVLATQVEFFRIKGNRAEEERIASIARLAFWSVEIRDGIIEKYSLKLNAQIETAHQNQNEFITIINEDNEECRIQLNESIEICGERKRRVIRKDFHLPSHWKPQSENVLRCILATDDEEYQTALSHFNETMWGNYKEIQIERIQNQRWYMSYRTYRHSYKQKDTEKLLFHGCAESSADMIIHSCFNRSFAGVNGVLYGIGVYFSKQASYSHNYTRESPTSNRRCMFLAKVIVGRSALGDKTMKTPPAGYDSTTDNDHIFVTYHDDQAYAAYLITYMSVDNSS